jgi:hypothetical protein
MQKFDDKEDGLVVWISYARSFDFMPAAEIASKITDVLLREASDRYPGREFVIEDREHPNPILRHHGDRYRCVFLA